MRSMMVAAFVAAVAAAALGDVTGTITTEGGSVHKGALRWSSRDKAYAVTSKDGIEIQVKPGDVAELELRKDGQLVGTSAITFVAEPEILPDCPWPALMPKWVPLFGVVLFIFICVMPLAVVRRLGENRWTLGGWGLVLLVFAIITASTGRFKLQSASERFVKHVLADLGDRKHIIGDGIFDVMIDEWKPSDVERVGTTTVAERLFSK